MIARNIISPVGAYLLREGHVTSRILIASLVGCMLACVVPASVGAQDLNSLNKLAVSAERSVVKLYGAGGVAGLDAFQSGILISDKGHILTVWSTVLDVDDIIAVSSDGTRRKAQVLGIDPNLEIAILESGQAADNFFKIDKAPQALMGERVLALSNLYGIASGQEMASVQKGVVMALTDLNARRGSFDSVYRGQVVVIDAMTNNPGAAGGALINLKGQLLGLLGKELRDADTNIWMNYAIPISELAKSIQGILEGKPIARAESRQAADRPASLDQLGLILIPNVLPKTPAFVDLIQPGSPSQKAGLLSDDLILFMNSVRITSQDSLREELSFIDRADEIALLVQRGKNIIELKLNKR